MLNPNGHPGKTTCETLGLKSIKDKVECRNASKSIPYISNYTQKVSDEDCNDYNPNHCFSNTDSEVIHFTADHCPVHGGITHEIEGLICKTCRGKKG
jgi:hypothetical protein